MYQDGKTDFLCCDGNYAHRGSYSDPFTEEEHELKFRHLTSRIRFVGKRDAVMYGVISVNNVKVTLLQRRIGHGISPRHLSLIPKLRIHV